MDRGLAAKLITMCFLYFFLVLIAFDLFVIFLTWLYERWYKRKYGILPEWDDTKPEYYGEPWPEDYM